MDLKWKTQKEFALFIYARHMTFKICYFSFCGTDYVFRLSIQKFQILFEQNVSRSWAPPIWTVLADGNRPKIWKIATKFLHV